MKVEFPGGGDLSAGNHQKITYQDAGTQYDTGFT